MERDAVGRSFASPARALMGESGQQLLRAMSSLFDAGGGGTRACTSAPLSRRRRPSAPPPPHTHTRAHYTHAVHFTPEQEGATWDEDWQVEEDKMEGEGEEEEEEEGGGGGRDAGGARKAQ
jgi:hypothetical protein